MKFLITGDLVVDCKYEISQISNEVKELFNANDCNIVNLEAPIVNESASEIEKTGPHLSSNRESLNSIVDELKIDVFCLANNHLKDFGDEGVMTTLEYCKRKGLDFVGGGKNINDARNILYKETIEGKVAIINIAENEWSSSSEAEPGGNPISLIENYYSIIEAKANADFVVLIFHGGTEMYHLPSLETQKMCRFFIDAGVDLVVGHHPHVIGGKELYKGREIYYSLGNFLFTEKDDNPNWYIGGVLEVEINKRSLVTKIHYTTFNKEDFSLRLLNDKESLRIKSFVESLNEVIISEELLKQKWKELVDEKYKSYLLFFSPINHFSNRYFRAVCNRLGLLFINRKALVLLLNLIRCESHLNLSRDILKKYLSKN